MAEAFKPSVLVSQSIDGKQLTVTDNSNYATNTESVTSGDITSKIATIYDSDDTLLDTVDFTAAPFTYDLTKDVYLRFALVFETADDEYTGETVFLSLQFYNITQSEIAAKLSCDCECGSEALCSNMTKAREFSIAAQNAFIGGQDEAAQTLIDSANTLLTIEGC